MCHVTKDGWDICEEHPSSIEVQNWADDLWPSGWEEQELQTGDGSESQDEIQRSQISAKQNYWH